jgi:FlaA1/EpsC-like NDP-sugar epimerase
LIFALTTALLALTHNISLLFMPPVLLLFALALFLSSSRGAGMPRSAIPIAGMILFGGAGAVRLGVRHILASAAVRPRRVAIYGAGDVGAGLIAALGQDRKFANVVDSTIAEQIDDALGLQMISIRLEKDLINSFKLLGTKYSMGYQPLMREALKRFVDGEFKLIASEALEKQKSEKQKIGAIGKIKKAA